MRAKSVARRAGIVLLCVLALVSCSSAVRDHASGTQAEAPAGAAGTAESAREPEPQASKPQAHPPSVEVPAVPETPEVLTPEDPPLPEPVPTVTVVEATAMFSTFDPANRRFIDVPRKVFRFMRRGDDLTQHLVIRLTSRYGGRNYFVTSGFGPGEDTSDYPSVGVETGVVMAVALSSSEELQPYIDLTGLGPQHGYRPYILGGSTKLTITGT